MFNRQSISPHANQAEGNSTHFHLAKPATRRLLAATMGATLSGILSTTPAFAVTQSTLSTPSSAGNQTVTVQAGQSLWSIARIHGIPLTDLEAANPGVQPLNLQIGSILRLPLGLYRVQSGDTFWNIAQRLHVPENALMTANPGIPAGDLQVGQVLNLPAGLSLGLAEQTSASTSVARQRPFPQRTTPSMAISGTSQTAHSTQTTTANSGASSTSAAVQQTVSASANVSNITPSPNGTQIQQNLYWLAKIIHAEADGEPMNAQISVGDVVWHRVLSPDYPNTVEGVVFQISNGHYQFSSVTQGFFQSSPGADNLAAARAVLQQHEDLVPGAYVFYNPAQTPSGSWVWSQPTIAHIGAFVFAH